MSTDISLGTQERNESMKSIFDLSVRDFIINRNFSRIHRNFIAVANRTFSSRIPSRSWKAIPRIKEPPINADFILKAFKEGDVAFLRVLLDYKITMYYSIEVYLHYEPQGVESSCSANFVSEEKLLEDPRYWETQLREFFDETSCERNIQIKVDESLPVSPRRMWYIVLALEVMRNFSIQPISFNKKRCFRLMIDFTQEPRITVTEIEDLLRHFLENSDNAESFVINFREQFLKEFPEFDGPYQPRSLQHLSRCQVRQSMRNVGKVPQDLRDVPLLLRSQQYLPFPTRLLQYLLLDEYITIDDDQETYA